MHFNLHFLIISKANTSFHMFVFLNFLCGSVLQLDVYLMFKMWPITSLWKYYETAPESNRNWERLCNILFDVLFGFILANHSGKPKRDTLICLLFYFFFALFPWFLVFYSLSLKLLFIFWFFFFKKKRWGLIKLKIEFIKSQRLYAKLDEHEFIH